jgi:membrane protein
MTTPHSPTPPDDLGDDARRITTLSRRLAQGARTRFSAIQSWLDRNRGDRPVIDIGMRLHERDREAAGQIAGSAVAFRLFLFFVPTLLVLVAIAGFLAAHLSSRDVAETTGVSGALADQIELAFSQSTTARWTALLAGLLGMATSGRSLAKGLVLASALSWRVSPQGQRATVRVILLVGGAMVSIALVTTIVNRVRESFGAVVTGASMLGVSVAYFVAWMALTFALPRATRDPGALLPGAALVGVTMAILQAITQFYVPARLEQASSLYGGMGATIVTLGVFFIIGRLAVLSLTIDAVIYERLGSVTTVVFGLPVLRRLPGKVPPLARFFGLDEGSEGAEPAPVDEDGPAS